MSVVTATTQPSPFMSSPPPPPCVGRRLCTKFDGRPLPPHLMIPNVSTAAMVHLPSLSSALRPRTPFRMPNLRALPQSLEEEQPLPRSQKTVQKRKGNESFESSPLPLSLNHPAPKRAATHSKPDVNAVMMTMMMQRSSVAGMNRNEMIAPSSFSKPGDASNHRTRSSLAGKDMMRSTSGRNTNASFHAAPPQRRSVSTVNLGTSGNAAFGNRSNESKKSYSDILAATRKIIAHQPASSFRHHQSTSALHQMPKRPSTSQNSNYLWSLVGVEKKNKNLPRVHRQFSRCSSGLSISESVGDMSVSNSMQSLTRCA